MALPSPGPPFPVPTQTPLPVPRVPAAAARWHGHAHLLGPFPGGCHRFPPRFGLPGLQAGASQRAGGHQHQLLVSFGANRGLGVPSTGPTAQPEPHGALGMCWFGTAGMSPARCGLPQPVPKSSAQCPWRMQVTAVLPSRVGVCGCPLPHIGDGLGAEDLWSCKEPRGELRGVQHGRARCRIDPIVVPTHVPRISHTSCTTSTRREIPKSTMWMSPGEVQVSRMFWG